MKILFMLPVLVGAYHAVVWHLRQRQLDPASIVIRYSPPEGLSPAAARYLEIGDVDWKSVAASLLVLSSAGCVKILRLGEKCEVQNLHAEPSRIAQLRPEEANILTKLFPMHNEKCFLDASTSGNIALEMFLNFKMQLDKLGYRYHWTTLTIVWLATVLSYVCLMSANTALPTMVAIYFMVIAVLCPVLWKWLSLMRDVMARRLSGLAVLNVLVMSAVGFGFLPALMYLICSEFSRNFNLSLLASSIVLLAGARLFRVPTLALKTKLDEIEGYRRFLADVEQDRMQRLNSDDKSTDTEFVFAYAVALDVKEPVGDQLSEALLFAQSQVLE